VLPHDEKRAGEDAAGTSLEELTPIPTRASVRIILTCPAHTCHVPRVTPTALLRLTSSSPQVLRFVAMVPDKLVALVLSIVAVGSSCGFEIDAPTAHRRLAAAAAAAVNGTAGNSSSSGSGYIYCTGIKVLGEVPTTLPVPALPTLGAFTSAKYGTALLSSVTTDAVRNLYYFVHSLSKALLLNLQSTPPSAGAHHAGNHSWMTYGALLRTP